MIKDLPRRIAFDKLLSNKALEIDKTPQQYEYQRGLPSMVYNFFDKKTSGGKKREVALNTVS